MQKWLKDLAEDSSIKTLRLDMNKKAGQPRLESGKQIRRNVTLSDRLIEKAKLLGGGNISKGIRRALDEFKPE